jgi:hypothetical protein
VAVQIKRLGYATISSTAPGAKYTRSFVTTDWTLNGSDYELLILAAVHSKGSNLQIQVYQQNGADYEEVIVGINVLSSGNVVLTVSSTPDARFNGKVLIN